MVINHFFKRLSQSSKKLIKKRKINTTNRIYIQDKELVETAFTPNSHFIYIVKKGDIIIVPCDESQNTVVARKLPTGLKSVIDIRSKAALDIFSNSHELTLYIYHDKIVVSSHGTIVELEKSCTIARAVGDLSYLGEKAEQVKEDISHVLDVVSLFSGAGFLDSGFIKEGFNIKFALELEKDMCETYRTNLGEHIVNADINTITRLPEAKIILAGSPCQALSNANRVNNARTLDDPRNKLIKKTIELVKKVKSCLVFVLENVPQLVSAGGGKFIREIQDNLPEFEISINKVNSVDFGVPQLRERCILIASRIGRIDLKAPALKALKTVRDAFKGLNNLIPNQLDYSKPSANSISKMKYIQAGENYRSIPEALRPHSQHSNMYKRLKWDEPSITIVNPRKSMILHPEEHRIISVREAARLQSVDDTFIFKGKLSSMQQMVANGVPVKLAQYIARTIKLKLDKFLYT